MHGPGAALVPRLPLATFFDPSGIVHSWRMNAEAMFQLKQQLVRMSAKQRQEVAAFLHKLKEESPAWKKEMARRMTEMDVGKKF